LLNVSVCCFTQSGQKETKQLCFDKWYETYKNVKAEQTRMTKSNIPTEKQALCQFKWYDILRTKDKLPYASQNHLLLSMCTLLPPHRQLHYAQFKVYTDPLDEPAMDHNHFHLFNKWSNTPYIFIQEYKTAKYYADFNDTQIPTQLIDIVSASFKKKPRIAMLVQNDGTTV
jgi:hypothetical protein